PAGQPAQYQAPASQSAPQAPAGQSAPQAPAAQSAPQAPAAQSAPQAPASESTPDLASTDLSGGVKTKIPFEASATGNKSLIPTVKEAAAALNEAKPLHGNLWM
ncbi:hypothetical protein ACWDPP_01770, partial [Streptomyces sp. NPDC000851]